MENISHVYEKLITFPVKTHLIISLIIRFGLIGYSIYHDAVFTVPYTDIDYKVFTDASRHILEGQSPYDRHTYRYSPLLAIILVPNILVCAIFGKILFSVIDIFVALLIREIVSHNIREFINEKNNHESQKVKMIMESYSCKSMVNLSMLIWLYNPLAIAIATRGNCDTIAGYLVLTTIYLIQCKKKFFLGGLVHGLAIHFRLYPIFYSLTFFMFASKFSYYHTSNTLFPYRKYPEERKTIFRKRYFDYFLPNQNQVSLVSGCLFSLMSLIGIFYYIYDRKFIYETYLYHFIRHDARHNFSLYFYLQYLTAFIKNVPVWQKILITMPQLILLLVVSVKYGLNKISMNFGILLQTIIMVSYNTVLTSQYFIWILVILPLCLWQIKISFGKGIFWILIWFAAQGAWLLPAYLLEFKGQNTFIFIWLQGVAFFSANIAILGRLLMYHQPYNNIVTKKIH